ncbi:MAG: polysaccharide deacetylase [Lachnospiraceae bacterium]|nr:polysaccharide deacetylase [Lachnospiraceae bacterium]
MAKITRAELARRKRVEFYKKIIIYGYLTLTILPILTSAFLFYRINQLEKKLDYALSEEGGDYLTFRSSREALADNPNSVDGVFADSTRTVLSSANVKEEAENAEKNGNPNENDGLKEEAVEDSSTTDGEKVNEESQQEALAESSKAVKRVYLTFDDGPSIYTGQILDILAANNVKATFFVIGRDENYYDYYRRIVDEGHTIGMHSYSHVYQDFYASEKSFGEELTKLSDLIYDVTGTRTLIFRFPGGSSNSVAPLPIQNYIAYLNENNINYYDWNSLSGDAVTNGLSPEQLVDNVMNDVEKNRDSIVLMHDLQSVHTTVESLQLLIDTLKSGGYEILPIDANTPLIQHVSCNSVEE